ncbi:MAG: thioredoxin family protein [Chitinispirillaceae bacterium]|nr:thioredoxin family protein [Chitinispirillaceae bacterium]
MKSIIASIASLIACITLVTCVEGPDCIDPIDSDAVIELDTASLIRIVLETDTIAMVEFYSTTCRYCIQSVWIIDSLNKVYGDSMLFAKVNTELYNVLWTDFQLAEIPTFIFYVRGKEHTRRTFHEIQGAGAEYDSLAALTEEVLALTHPFATCRKEKSLER